MSAPGRPLRARGRGAVRALAVTLGAACLAAAGLVGASASAAVPGPATTGPAPACVPDLDPAVRGSTDVFTGTVGRLRTLRADEGTLVVVTVAVDTVRRGDVVTDEVMVELDAPQRRRVVPALPQRDRTYVFFARDRASDLVARRCGGYLRATPAVLERLDRIAPPQEPPAEPAQAGLREPEGGTPGEPAPVVQIMAPGLALAVVGALGLFVVGVTARRL